MAHFIRWTMFPCVETANIRYFLSWPFLQLRLSHMTLTLSIRSTISEFSQKLVTPGSRGSAESRLVTRGDILAMATIEAQRQQWELLWEHRTSVEQAEETRALLLHQWVFNTPTIGVILALFLGFNQIYFLLFWINQNQFLKQGGTKHKMITMQAYLVSICVQCD